MVNYSQGTMLEKFLTMPPEEFKLYLRDAPELAEEELDTRREAFRFSKVFKQWPSTVTTFFMLLSIVRAIHHALTT